MRKILRKTNSLSNNQREEQSPFALQSSPAACTAGAERFLRRKIPFFKAKIASLQFPRPKIRRILAETGGGARRPPPVAETGRSKPNEQGRTASALCAHRRPEGLEWRAHEAKRSAQPRNTAQASAQGGAKMRNDHCELRMVVAGEQALPPPGAVKKPKVFSQPLAC